MEPSIPFYRRLYQKCQHCIEPLRTAVVHPVEAASLNGAITAGKESLITPVLVGPKQQVEAVAQAEGIELDGYACIEAESCHESAAQAVALARAGKVDALMKGHLHTDELLSAVLDKEKGLRTKHRMSHVFCIDIPHANYPKPLWLSDAALNIAPDFKTHQHIIQNAIDLFRACGFGQPKVAVLSATEQITEHIPFTLRAAALSKLASRQVIEGGLVDGPLAFDNAISREAARVKRIHSDVAGDADILIAPDLESGNLLYKQMKYLSGYDAAGLVVGGAVPIMLTSRAGGLSARLASAALALLYCSSDEGKPV